MNLQKIFPYLFLLLCLNHGPAASAQEKWQERRCRHFDIYYKDAPEDFIANVEDTAERFYGEINSNLGFSRYMSWSSQDRIKIYIYRDQTDFMAGSQQENWSHGVAYFRKKEIRTFPAAYGFFDSILPHELGHIVFREFVGDNASIPLWLDEGVAMFQERAKRWGAHQIVKKAVVEGQYFSLAQLSQMRFSRDTPRETIELFYAEAASVTYYMINDLGQQRFVGFCRRLQEGSSFLEALKRSYSRFKDLDSLNKAWLDYLERQ